MYVKTSRSTTELYVDDLVDEPIEFDEDGISRVPAEVGDALVERYDAISVEEDERDDTAAGDHDRDPEAGDAETVADTEADAEAAATTVDDEDVEAVADDGSADDDPDAAEDRDE